MSINDPIADMLTRIRNGLMSNHTVEVAEDNKPPHKTLRVRLKYVGERRTKRPVITEIRRVSKPGRRVYTQKREIPWVLSGMGISILSTPKGVMTGQSARKNGVGGEILCKVW